MFSDVLGSLRQAQRVDAVAVVTRDHAAETLSLELATVLPDESQAGQSEAAEVGIGHAIAAGYERALLVPGDTPLIDPAEIDLLLDRSARDGLAVAIVADRHGNGTNALVLTPPDALAPAFGPGSLARHVSAAEADGRPHRVEPCSSLALDVDTPDDLATLMSTLERVRGGAQRTRGVLRQLERTGSLRALAAARS
jgi:2-phospho-L-lactate/phosphoenolpyruvate guanylyltransferase